MIVCHCHVVNDARIREVIARGARDEFDVAAACDAGTGCGGCVPAISRLLGECADCPLALPSTEHPAPGTSVLGRVR